MGLLLCFVMPVFSWCSFTTSVANSKMKLLVWNRVLGHRVLCLRVLGWLFLIAVKQVSASDVAAVGALEQVSFSKEIKPESQRLNITHFSRVFLFYSTNKKPVFCEQYIESYKQGNFTYSESCCLSSTFYCQIHSPDLVVSIPCAHQTTGTPCLVCYRVASSFLFLYLSNL